MIPEREREALMRLTMCAREECGMCKYEDTCDFDFQYETATRCMNILADALRTSDSKTEPLDKDINIHSKDCETCKHYKLACKLFSEVCKYEPKNKPQTDYTQK